jgi:hypothetical protein
MKAIWKPGTTTLGLAMFAATLTPSMFAGCGGEMPGKAAPAAKQPPTHFLPAAYQPARFVLVENSPPGAAIVGFWHVVFTQDQEYGGKVSDDSYVQWHSDGTEIMNSGTHGSGAFCMGVWAKTGNSTYALNHVALDYSLTHGITPDVIAILHEQVTVDKGGMHFTGRYTTDLYAPYSSDFPATPGFHIGQVDGGTITAERITAN